MNARLLHNVLVALLALLSVTVGFSAQAQPLPEQLRGVDVVENLGDYVDLDLEFVDEEGKTVRLGDYFHTGKPVIVTLNYYNCPMLCSMQLNGMIDGLRELPWAPGDHFRIVTLSIDPREGPDLASAKREAYLEALGKGQDVEWTFLTGEDENIRALSEKLGFGYRYVREIDEYAHPAAIFFLSDEGRITRYLYGLQYRPFDLRMAITEAGEGRVGTTVDRIILSCFHYDSSSNSYAVFAFGVMRISGIVTVLILGGLLGILWVRDLRRRLAKE